MFKITMIGMLTFMSSIIYANEAYFGLGLGRNTANFDKKLKIENAYTNNLEYYKHDNQPGRGILEDTFVGYRWDYNHFNFATELNFSLSSLKYHGYFIDYENNETSEATYRLNQSYGVSILPGYKISDNWILYARMGMVKGNFKYSEYKSTVISALQTGVTEWKWLNGLRYGLGIEGQITNNIDLRLEYSQISYQTYTNTSFPLASGNDRTIKLTPATDQMTFSLIYRFF